MRQQVRLAVLEDEVAERLGGRRKGTTFHMRITGVPWTSST
jgi:hypothetical protein